MLFQVHDAPGFNGSPSGQTKWKGESHIDDGPYAISNGDWTSVGEHCDFVRAFANYNDTGLRKVAAVVGPTVARRVETLIGKATALATANAELAQQAADANAERDELVDALAAAEAVQVELREELEALRPFNVLVESLSVEPKSKSSKVAA